jgi:hypothetical protein
MGCVVVKAHYDHVISKICHIWHNSASRIIWTLECQDLPRRETLFSKQLILVLIYMLKSDFEFLHNYLYLNYVYKKIDSPLSMIAGSQQLSLGQPSFFT